MSEVRTFFEDAAGRLFASKVDLTTVEAAEAGTFPAGLWAALAENGFPMLRTPEAAGGVNASTADAAAVMRLAGRHVVPGPLLETIIANRLLASAGFPITEGARALAFAPEGALTREGGTIALAASPSPSAWAREVDRIVIVGATSGQTLIAQATSGALGLSRSASPVGEPRYRIAPGRAAAETGVLQEGAAGEALLEAAILNAARMAGALEWCLETTVDYSMQRSQFGRALAKFQAVQQMLAQLASEVVASRAIADAAAEAGPASPILAAAARSRIGDSVDLAVAISHQVHGAIGFSRDYALNYRTRRLMQWRDEFGTTEHWRLSLATPFAGLRVEELWPAVVTGGGLGT